MSKNLAPNEVFEKEKKRIIPLIKKQLNNDGLLDLTGWIEENCDKTIYGHSAFVRSVGYRMERLRSVEVIPVENWNRFYIKHITWDRRHPYLNSIILGIIGSVFSLLVGITVALTVLHLKETDQKRIDELQDIRYKNLQDTQSKFQTYILDSLSSTKHETMK